MRSMKEDTDTQQVVESSSRLEADPEVLRLVEEKSSAEGAEDSTAAGKVAEAGSLTIRLFHLWLKVASPI